MKSRGRTAVVAGVGSPHSSGLHSNQAPRPSPNTIGVLFPSPSLTCELLLRLPRPGQVLERVTSCLSRFDAMQDFLVPNFHPPRPEAQRGLRVPTFREVREAHPLLAAKLVEIVRCC